MNRRDLVRGLSAAALAGPAAAKAPEARRPEIEVAA
jgi:hypothetical protein